MLNIGLGHRCRHNASGPARREAARPAGPSFSRVIIAHAASPSGPSSVPNSARQQKLSPQQPRPLAQSPSAASTLDASAPADATSSISTSSATSKAECPFHQLKSAFSNATAASSPAASISLSPSSATPAGTVPIPGPPALSWEALQDVSVIFLEGLHVAMLRFSDKYGPVCRFANPASLNGATSWVFLNSPDAVQHVCATNVRNYGRRYLPDIYTYVTHGKGILGSQDEYNARHRRLCAGPFRSRQQLQRFSTTVVDRSRQLADTFQAAAAAAAAAAGGSGSAPGFETDMATQTQRLTLDVVGLVAFSHDFHQVDAIARDLAGAAADPARLQDRVLWAVNTFGEVLAQVFITPLPLLKLADRLGLPHLRSLDEAVAVMRRAMLDVIQERRVELAAGGAGRDDLLQALLTSTDDAGRGLTDEELWEDVHDIMGAGHETTATTAAALLYCVSSHPAVRARVEAELDAVLGGAPPSYEALDRMPYLQACAKEVMRLYPAIPVFPREAARDDVLPSGHAVRAGDVVFMSSYALGRSAAIWDKPLEFDPERFSPEAEARQHRFAWLPFGAGPRMCLGSSFAQMSVCLMAATLLQRFRFTPLHPASPLPPAAYDITLNFNPTGGLRMRVEPR